MPGQDTATHAIFKSAALESTSYAGPMELMERIPVHQPTWYFIYLFVLIGLFAWIRLYYGNILAQTVQASTNFQLASRMFQDNSLLQKQLDTLLYVFYLVSMAFMLYQIEIRVGLSPYALQGALLYLFNLALLTGMFICRIVLINIAGFLFNRLKLVREYLYNNFIFNKLSGMAALPLMFLMVYTKDPLQELFFWISILVLSGFIVMRILRGIVFSYRKEVLVFYMFLYLCALEIAPLVLLYRWLEGVL